MTIECQYCRRPEPQVYQLISRHTTSEGVIVYARCVCGTLHRYLVDADELRSWYRADTAPPAPEPTVTAA